MAVLLGFLSSSPRSPCWLLKHPGAGFALPSSCRKGTSPALHCPVHAARALHLLCTAKVHRTFSVSPQPPDLLRVSAATGPSPCLRSHRTFSVSPQPNSRLLNQLVYTEHASKRGFEQREGFCGIEPLFPICFPTAYFRCFNNNFLSLDWLIKQIFPT